MVNIAIISESDARVIESTLVELFKMCDLNVFCYNDYRYRSFKQLTNNGADIFVAPISAYLLESKKSNIDIFLFGSSNCCNSGNVGLDVFESKRFQYFQSLNLFNEDAIVIMNCDDKEIIKYLAGSSARILTYGFNGKASITASSVLESMDNKFIQICVQRRFVAINGSIIDVQEIPITLPLRKNSQILTEMAAIAAALCVGIHSKMITLLIGR